MRMSEDPAARPPTPRWSGSKTTCGRRCGGVWSTARPRRGSPSAEHWNFWVVRGLLTEGRAWLTQLAALPDAAKAPTPRAVALTTAQGHYSEAQATLTESLRLRQDMGDPSGIADTLESIAALAAADGQPAHAVQLAGAAAGLREAIGARSSPMGQSTLDQWLVPVRHILGEESTSVAWEAGRTTSVDQATELALGPMGASPNYPNRQQDNSRQRVAS